MNKSLPDGYKPGAGPDEPSTPTGEGFGGNWNSPTMDPFMARHPWVEPLLVLIGIALFLAFVFWAQS